MPVTIFIPRSDNWVDVDLTMTGVCSRHSAGAGRVDVICDALGAIVAAYILAEQVGVQAEVGSVARKVDRAAEVLLQTKSVLSWREPVVRGAMRGRLRSQAPKRTHTEAQLP